MRWNVRRRPRVATARRQRRDRGGDLRGARGIDLVGGVARLVVVAVRSGEEVHDRHARPRRTASDRSGRSRRRSTARSRRARRRRPARRASVHSAADVAPRTSTRLSRMRPTMSMLIIATHVADLQPGGRRAREVRRAEHALLLARERDEDDVARELAACARELRARPRAGRRARTRCRRRRTCGSCAVGRQRVAPADAEVIVVRADHDRAGQASDRRAPRAAGGRRR